MGALLIRSHMDRQYTPIIESTLVTHYSNNIRSIKNLRTSSILYENKVSIKDTVSKDGTYRYVVSTESPLSDINDVGESTGTTYRLRYMYNNISLLEDNTDIIGSLHITFRTESRGYSNVSIEIEIPKEYTPSVMDSIVRRIYILHNGWDVPNLSSTISSMRSIMYDAGIRGPDNLQTPYDIRYSDLVYSNMIERQHAISFKADGNRMLLILSPVGTFFCSSTISIVPIDTVSTPSTYIVDGELMDDTYWVFDMLYSTSNDITTLSYSTRYSMLEKALPTISRVYNIRIKPIRIPTSTEEFFSAIEWTREYTTSNNIKTDGIIITGINQVYNTNVYKWKDPSDMSVDFFIGPSTNGNGVLLGSYDKGSIVYHDNYIVDDDLSQHIGTVAEFQYIGGIPVQWRYVRTRYDKVRPNSVFVLNSILSLHRDPITWNVITGRSLSLMRKYHNRVKRAVYDMMDVSTITDIGSGRGGDLSSWIRNHLNVIAVEPDPVNVSALLERASDAHIEHIDNSYYDIDGVGWCGTLYPMKVEDYVNTDMARTDALTLFNSITFMSIDTICTLINEAVHDNGTVVMMLMDGKVLQDTFLRSSTSYTSSLIHIERVSCMESTNRGSGIRGIGTTGSTIGNMGCIYISLGDSSTVSDGQTEGLVDVDVLLSVLRDSDWIPDIDMFLTQERLMGREESMYSSAQRLIVLRKSSTRDHVIRELYMPLSVGTTSLIKDSPWGDIVRVGVLDNDMSMTHALLQAYDQSYRSKDNISKTIIATSRNRSIVNDIDVPIYIIPSTDWNIYYGDRDTQTMYMYPAIGGSTIYRKPGIVLMYNRDHWEPIAKRMIGDTLHYIW